jgi:prepilin-type N-terminal cleavage/methylation domain-containing protein
MLRALLQRLAREESGMTLIELLIVSTILGILTSLATPSYLGLRDSANKAASSANVYAIVPDVEWYSFDNFPGSNTSRDPDYNGSDAAYSGTNADDGYTDSWSGHDFLTILQTKYDPSIDPTKYTWDPAGWSPAAGFTTATDFCVYTIVGQWYGAKHGASGAITTGKTMHLGANGDCFAS